MAELNAKEYILAIAEKAKKTAAEIANRDTQDKNAALKAIAENLVREAPRIIEENKKDMAYSESIGKSKAILDRLLLTEARIKSMAKAVEEIAALPDPVGSGNHTTKSPGGLRIQKIRVPLGVVAMIYEARPNVTSDAAALCLKSGNAVILRGGKEAIHSNTAIAGIVRDALTKVHFPVDAVQLIEQTDHAIVDEMLQLDKLIDVVIPRGGESLIKSVSEKSKIPVIKHDKGVCHIYVDANADKAKAENIAVNAKCQRPSVCNSAEKLLIHQDYPYRKEIIQSLIDHKVEVIVDAEARKDFPQLSLATEDDWYTEYLDYKITVGIVKDTEAAIEHINCYGSHHSDAIVSENYTNVQRFLARVDSAAVYANASTRFTDGGEFGLGAEIGISTQKLHVRGPMGLAGLTTEKWIIYGDGHIRE